MSALIEIDQLTICAGEHPVVDNLSLSINAHETLALVGESGSGKSVTALACLRLFETSALRIAGGAIRFEGVDLLTMPEKALRKIRGNDVAMIFQEPMTSLNPVYTVGDQIIEAIRTHRSVTHREARDRTIELLRKVRIPAAEHRADDYPHQLSGGMRQRVMIAMALALQPKLLIADEPTTALDVTVQAQILDLLAQLQEEFKMGVWLITHDLGVVRNFTQRVAVMYAGTIVETTTTNEIFSSPSHPYTQGLIESAEALSHSEPRALLPTIRGAVPTPGALVGGCAFRNRCEKTVDLCAQQRPELRPIGSADHHHLFACWVDPQSEEPHQPSIAFPENRHKP